MSKTGAQAVSSRSSTPSLPTPLPYSNKEDAKKHVLPLQGWPQGKFGDELKTELEAPNYDLGFQAYNTRILQYLGVDPATQMIQNIKELEVGPPNPAELPDIVDNDKMKQLRTHLAETDEIDLRNKVKELTKDKKALENQIEGFKQDVGKLQMTVVEKDKIIQKLMEMHDERIEKVTEESQEMQNRIKELESTIEELANMNESGIIVGETMKIMVKAIYQHVHPTLPLRTNFYAVHEISDHLYSEYKDKDPNEKMAAERRWDKLKDDLGWDKETEKFLRKFIKIRNQKAHPPVDEIKFRDALRQMKEEKDIKDKEERFAYNFFTQCQRKFKIYLQRFEH